MSCDYKSLVEHCNGHGDKIVVKKTIFISDKSVPQHLSCHDGEDLPTLDVALQVICLFLIYFVVKLFHIAFANIQFSFE